MATNVTSSGTTVPIWVLNIPIIVPVNLRYNDANGDPVTSLYPLDYLTLVGQDLNTVYANITNINSTLSIQAGQITSLQQAVSTIPPVYNTPTISGQCLNSNTTQPIDTVLSLLVTAWCNFIAIAGGNTALNSAIAKQCPNLNSDIAFAGGQMAAITGWIASPQTLADSLTNLWLTVCDARTGIKNVQNFVLACPSLTASTVSTTSVQFTLFPYVTENVIYRADIYFASGGTSIENITFTNPTNPQTYTFTGLIAGTSYNIIITTTVTGLAPKTCPYITVSTSESS
jgi:hypothetical protein